MSPVEVILVFAGLPLLIVVVCYLLAVFNMRGKEHAHRYKLGERWESGPLWFVGRPRQVTAAHPGLRALTAGSPADSTTPTVVGGASGTW